MKLYRKIASLVVAINNCRKSGNDEWLERHSAELKALLGRLPSGSGFDAGVKLDIDKSSHDRLVFKTSFHHMDENGFYDGWTDHTIYVRPSLSWDITITVSGRDRNRNNIKDYIADVFSHVLNEEVD